MKVAQSRPTLCDPMDYTVWNSPGQNTGVGRLALFQGIFPIQGSNSSPALLADSLPAEPQEKPFQALNMCILFYRLTRKQGKKTK